MVVTTGDKCPNWRCISRRSDRIDKTADDHLRELLPDRWTPPLVPPDRADVAIFDP
ncbi:MAG: hypothetical protein KF795_22860 [Labilithrix sp.]|nr:hypothetical protein [Labilithrix sp.]